jgi:benzoate-CoA ligase
MNASTILDRNLEAGRAAKTAIITAEHRRLSYADVYTATCRVAGRLADLGVRREERILMVLDDTVAFPATFLGAMRIGAIPIPINFLTRPDDFGYFLDDSYAVMAVVDAAFLDKVEPYVAARPGVRLVVANGPSPDHSLDGWLASGPGEIGPVATHPDDAAFWLYSSGSTGNPKGVVHLHHDIAFTCESYARGVLEASEGDVHFSTTKLFHAYGLGNNLTFPFWVGATAVYMTGRPNPSAALDRIEAGRPTLLFSVPALYNAMLNLAGFDQRDLSSVRLAVSAAEALPAEVWRRWQAATGMEILDGVGSTEMLHIYCSNRKGAVKPGSSGVPVPGYEIEIRDEEGRPMARAQAGELFVKGDSALSYYWHQHEKTKASLQGEWFRSGDRYLRDADGYFWYQGRVDDMMKVGGLWVSPIEIENRLMEHEAVSEAAVVAVEQDGLARIKAYVILREESVALGDLVAELQEWCRQALQRYQYPHLVAFVDDFPRTATGKIQRFKLR